MALNLKSPPQSTTAFLHQLRAKSACEDGYVWARANKATGFEDAWARLPRADWMLWLANNFGVALDDDLLRQFAFECADRAIHVHAVAALRSAGLTAEADKLAALPVIASEAALAASRAASWAASSDASRAASWAASSDASRAAWAAWAASSDASRAAWAASSDASRAASEAELLWQAGRLRELFPTAGPAA